MDTEHLANHSEGWLRIPNLTALPAAHPAYCQYEVLHLSRLEKAQDVGTLVGPRSRANNKLVDSVTAPHCSQTKRTNRLHFIDRNGRAIT
jgi:hypothetical protein